MADNAERNAEIIRRRKAGQWPRQIAAEMGLTKSTVIGVTNRAGLAVSGAQDCPENTRRGAEVPTAALTDSRVLELRETYRPRDPVYGMAARARQWGVRVETLYNAYYRRTWAHVPTPETYGERG